MDAKTFRAMSVAVVTEFDVDAAFQEFCAPRSEVAAAGPLPADWKQQLRDKGFSWGMILALVLEGLPFLIDFLKKLDILKP